MAAPPPTAGNQHMFKLSSGAPSRLTTAAPPRTSRSSRTAAGLTTAGSSSYGPTRLATAAGSMPPPTAVTTFSVARGLAGLNASNSREALRIKKKRLPSNNWWKSFGRPAPRIGVNGSSLNRRAEVEQIGADE